MLQGRQVTVDGDPKVQDENGDLWEVFASDGAIAAIQRDEKCGVFVFYEIIPVDDGYTFGVNCVDEFIAKDGEWRENS